LVDLDSIIFREPDFLKYNILSNNTSEIRRRRPYFQLIWTAVILYTSSIL
jgi:hypothetical protein